jgi:hypothetical protein
MDGKSTLISKMANTAATKGILVVNAAGNDGDNEWNRIGAPADADSILSVGGIDPNTDYKISFSSVGPTADFRPKPNVSAYGKVVVVGEKGIQEAFGTSFASPLVAGFAACAKQIYPNYNATQLKKSIEKSGHLYPYYDYAHGYGIPQASKLLNQNLTIQPTFTWKKENKNIIININNINTEKESQYESYLFYNIMNENDIIYEWGIIETHENHIEFFQHNNWEETKYINLHYKGYTEKIDIK